MKLESKEKQSKQQSVCAYHNSSKSWQIIKIANKFGFFWEKAVLPHQRVIFSADANDELQVFSYEYISAMSVDTIPCRELQVN